MRRARTLSRFLEWAVPAAAFAASPMARAQERVPVAGTDRYRVRYADSTVSINDLCPVAKRPLGEKQTPFYVNGRPVGFC
jgi:hypothetical protein